MNDGEIPIQAVEAMLALGGMLWSAGMALYYLILGLTQGND